MNRVAIVVTTIALVGVSVGWQIGFPSQPPIVSAAEAEEVCGAGGCTNGSSLNTYCSSACGYAQVLHNTENGNTHKYGGIVVVCAGSGTGCTAAVSTAEACGM